MRLHVVYRSAPVENRAQRPAYYSKDACLGSFIGTLTTPGLPLGDVIFVNDGVIEGQRRAAMEKHGTVLELPCIGNGPSYRAVLSMPDWRGWDDDDLVYLVEDDYLHAPEALRLLVQAARELTRAAFFSTYRHPNFIETRTHIRYRRRTSASAASVAGVRWEACWGTTLTYAARVHRLRLVHGIHVLAARQQHPNDIALWKATQRVLPYRLLSLFVAESTLKDQDVLRSAVRELVTRRARKQGLLMFPTPTLATHVHEPYLAEGPEWHQLAELGLAELSRPRAT